MQAIQGDNYDFSAKPKVVKPRTKYREPEEEDEDAYKNFKKQLKKPFGFKLPFLSENIY